MAPVVHGLEADYAGQVTFAFLDVDDAGADAFKEQLGYRTQPHMFLLDADGTVVAEWQGRTSAEEIDAAIRELLAQ